MKPSPDFPPNPLRVLITLAFLGTFIDFVVQGRPLQDEAVMGALIIASLARLQDLDEIAVWRFFRMTFRRRVSGEWREVRPPSRANELEAGPDETSGQDLATASADADLIDGDVG